MGARAIEHLSVARFARASRASGVMQQRSVLRARALESWGVCVYLRAGTGGRLTTLTIADQPPADLQASEEEDEAAAALSHKNSRMQSSTSTLMWLVAGLLLAACCCTVRAMPPAQCSPGLLDEVPPRIRKVCAALSTIYELGSAMESYINDKVPVLREGIPLPDSGVKRQDVDHVFLRFGRRR